MNRNPYTDNAIYKIGRSIRRRWEPAIWVFTGMFAATLLVAVLLPSRYVSHLKILVKNERANSLIHVGEQTQGVLYLNDVSEARINTEIELLTSNDLLRKVVEQCGLADAVSKRIQDPEKRIEIAVRDLQRALSVTQAHRSNVIEVNYSSRNPELSARVLQAVSNIYLNSHLQLHGAPGSYEFFDKMWKDASTQLNAAEDNLTKFRAAAHLVSLPEEKNVLLQHVADLQSRLAETVAEAQKSEQEASSYKSSIAHISSSVEKERRSIPNQMSTEQLNTLLVTLQNKRAEAAARYQPGDRIIRELDIQIKQTQDALEQAKSSPAQEVSTGTNPTFQSAENSLVQANAAFLGNMAQAASLRRQIRQDQARLGEMNAATTMYDELVRRRDDLARVRENYRKSRDEAYVGEALDKQRFSNVAVVESPIAEKVSALPRRGVILGVGLLWSLFAATLTALFLEFRTPQIYSPFELEQAMPVPLLAAVPRNAPLSFVAEEFPELYLAMQRTIFLPKAEVL